MHRTQIYITEEQQRRIAQRASDAAVSKAEVIRRILDSALAIDDGAAERRRAIQASAGVAAQEDDWPEWLARVRGVGGGADHRLSALGT